MTRPESQKSNVVAKFFWKTKKTVNARAIAPTRRAILRLLSFQSRVWAQSEQL